MRQSKIYIITFSLRHGWLRNYANFYAALQSFETWMHHIDSTWLVISDKTPEEIYEFLQPYLFNDCHILITTMSKDYFGSMPQEAWDWLEVHDTFL